MASVCAREIQTGRYGGFLHGKGNGLPREVEGKGVQENNGRGTEGHGLVDKGGVRSLVGLNLRSLSQPN